MISSEALKERLEELEAERPEALVEVEDESEHVKQVVANLVGWTDEQQKEIDDLRAKLDEIGNYEVTLIPEDEFAEYTEDLCKDCGYISKDFPSWIEIDWEATADNVRGDYNEIEFEGTTYLYNG
jgi:hypothetical protein